MTVSTVVVGYGYAGERIHVPLIRLASGLRLSGIVSGDAQKRRKIAETLACRTYASLDEVLQDTSVELVVLATPNALHAPQAIAAMRAGKHVIVDKPMCVNGAEADEMLRESRETGRALGVFHNRRYDSDFRTLCDLADSGELGEVRWLEMAWQRPGMPRSWKRRADQGGGRLIDLGSHMIDQVLQFFPLPVTSVYCRMHREVPDVDIDSHCMVVLGMADGRTAVIDTTMVTHAPKPRILALGAKATFVKHGMDPQEAALAGGDIESAAESPEQWGNLHDASGARRVKPTSGRWRSYYQAVASALTNWPDGQLPVTGQDGARVIRVIDAAFVSASSGRIVAVNV